MVLIKKLTAMALILIFSVQVFATSDFPSGGDIENLQSDYQERVESQQTIGWLMGLMTGLGVSALLVTAFLLFVNERGTPVNTTQLWGAIGLFMTSVSGLGGELGRRHCAVFNSDDGQSLDK